ncbi:hypothetical protein [Synergistes jonesii]|uniref:hypothetical protein n=1 Tax=Synergistes jonesii TaxID=2754 RepID=UPI003324822D
MSLDEEFDAHLAKHKEQLIKALGEEKTDQLYCILRNMKMDLMEIGRTLDHIEANRRASKSANYFQDVPVSRF